MAIKDQLNANESLNAGESLTSENGLYQLTLQTDGNLVLFIVNGQVKVWASDTAGKGGTILTMQPDGNLVMNNATGTAVWSTETQASRGSFFKLRNDRNMVVFNYYDFLVLWTSYTIDYAEGIPENWLGQSVYIWNNANGNTQFMTNDATKYDDTNGGITEFRISLANSDGSTGYFVQNVSNGKYLSHHATSLSDSPGSGEVINLTYTGSAWNIQNNENGEYYGTSASKLYNPPDTSWNIELASQYGAQIKTSGVSYL
jgi:hypothetical protein